LPFTIQGIGLPFFKPKTTYVTVHLHSISINTPHKQKIPCYFDFLLVNLISKKQKTTIKNNHSEQYWDSYHLIVQENRLLFHILREIFSKLLSIIKV